MKKISITVEKNKTAVGCILFKGEYTPIIMLKKVQDMLLNYNKNLSNVSCPNEVFGHRFLECKELLNTDWENASFIYQASYHKCKKFEKDYLFPSMSDMEKHEGCISLTPDDMHVAQINSHGYAWINLDTKTITLFKFFNSCHKDDYCKLKKIDKSDFTKLGIPEEDIVPEKFPINYLNDFMYFIEKNPKIFYNTYTHHVYTTL